MLQDCEELHDMRVCCLADALEAKQVGPQLLGLCAHLWTAWERVCTCMCA